MTFNLLTEPWIPVLYCNGNYERVGIRRALEDANSIHSVLHPSPLTSFAIFRFLLAVVHWLRPLQTVHELQEAWKCARYPADVCDRLRGQLSQGFDLLGDGQRFYQHPAARQGKRKPPWPASKLCLDVPSGTNINVLRHVHDDMFGQTLGLCLPCCVLCLVTLPPFAPRCGQGHLGNINGLRLVYVAPVGRNLHETLTLNQPLAECRDLWGQVRNADAPVWIAPANPKSAFGFLQRLTWVPWRLWLEDPERRRTLECVCCGHQGAGHISHVRRCSGVGAIDRQSSHCPDPHLLCHDGKSVSPRMQPEELRDGMLKAGDGGPATTLLGQLRVTQPRLGLAEEDVRLWIVGMDADQAKIENAWSLVMDRRRGPPGLPPTPRLPLHGFLPRTSDNVRPAAESFVRALQRLSPAELRGLAEAAGHPLGSNLDVFDLFRELYRPLRRKSVLPRWAAYLTATLYGLHREHERSGNNMGWATAGLREQGDHARAKARFERLLQSSGPLLTASLITSIRRLSRAGIAVDYVQLLDDLGRWHEAGRPIQGEWERRYDAVRNKEA